nr:DUF3304 domain-containing protein [Pseudomonas syringae pv. theae]
MRKSLMQGLCSLLALMLLGCSSADNEMAGGNIQAVNHTLSGINWLSVNGYRADGGGGRSCCIIMPIKWRPGLKANIEWEVDPDPFAKLPPLGTREFKAAMAKAQSSFQHHSTTVAIPEWPGTEGGREN